MSVQKKLSSIVGDHTSISALRNRPSRLVVIPSDLISAYEKKGTSSRLEEYYNPQKMFLEVFAVSPLEEGERNAYGMTILGVSERDFLGVLRDIRPDVVRAYGGYWPADLACRFRLPGVPVIVSVHDTNPSLVHRSVRYADLVVCMSSAVRKQVIKKGADPQRVRILPNRIDATRFRPVNNRISMHSIDCRFPAGKHVLCIGRKSRQKNLDTLLRAVTFLPHDYSCVFIGQGETSSYLQLATDLGVTDRCFWLDRVENDELPLWYSWCDCLCVPSRWEGFGLVFVEAAACGTPIVTSDIEPMNEYLTHNVSAHLVEDFNNPQALAKAICKVCEDPAYRRLLAAGAIKAAQPFDRKIIDAQEVAIYREAMNLEPFSLTRRIDLAIWQVMKIIVSTLAPVSPKRIVSKVGRRVIRLLR